MISLQNVGMGSINITPLSSKHPGLVLADGVRGLPWSPGAAGRDRSFSKACLSNLVPHPFLTC